jgi:hypothetical protein
LFVSIKSVFRAPKGSLHFFFLFYALSSVRHPGRERR